MKLISACLAGKNCKYDGGNNSNIKVLDLMKREECILVCPETLGGLKIPRLPAEIVGDKVIRKDGADVTKEFEKGAKETLRIAKENICDMVILKSRSPSCGCGKIYDGTFSGKLVGGDGITARLLKENGIKVITEEDIW